MTLGALLSDQARLRPAAAALVDERSGHTLSFAELQCAVGRAAGWWQSQGLRRGQAVLVFVPVSAELYVAMLGLFRLGAVAVFLDPSAGKGHIERCCERWAPSALLAVAKAHLLRVNSAAVRRIPLKASVGWWVPGARRWPTLGGSGEEAPDVAGPGDAALVTFTSGSTGVPKATVRTQSFLLAQYRALAPNLALEPGEVDLATLPIFVLANLAAGVTTVIPGVDLRHPARVDAARLFASIERNQVTRMTASPAFFERMVALGRATQRTLPTLRKIHTGGAPVFPRLLEALRALAPAAKVEAVYGSTEAEPIAHVSADHVLPADLAAMRAGRGLLAGDPVREIRLAVIRDEWGKPRPGWSAAEMAQSTLPAGETGEIVVAGDHVMKGYLGGIGDAETKFSVAGEIWHRTGDAGYRDERGRLWLLGRCSARIDDENGRLYPFGVECIAMTFPEVRRAAVIGHDGQRVLVVEAADDPGLERRLRDQTAGAHIREVVFLGQMPVDARHNGKVDYPALRDLLK